MISEVLAEVTTTFPSIGPLQRPSTLEELVRYIFIVTIVILGLLILWRLIRAGISWMLAGEDIQKIQAAKSMIWNAFLGAVIILSSVIFLRTLSPHFTQVSVPVEGPRKVTKHEVISGQKGIAFCKSNCARDNADCIEKNCENFTGGSANVEKLIKSGYNYLIGYGDPEEGKKNFAIFFDKSSYETGQPLSASKVRIWVEEKNREQTINDLSNMKSAIVGSYNTSEKRKVIVHFCNTIDPIKPEDFSKHCDTFSTEGSALIKENLSCKFCDRVRKIIIEEHGRLVITQDSNFEGYALYLPGPQTEARVGGLAPDRWAKQDMCIDKTDRQEKNCDSIPVEYREYLPVYIPVKSLLLIPE
jgi:hypothetical protein